MDAQWYHFVGYLGSYIGAYVVFVVAAAVVGRGRGLHTRWLAQLQLIYLIGMGAVAHALSFVVFNQRLTSHSLETFYDVAWFDPAQPSWSDLGRDLGELFETTGGLWGGPLAVVLAVLLMLVVVREQVEVKAALGDATAVAFPFSLALAKVGCFLAGCCHGVEGEGALFVTFDWIYPDAAAYGKTLFPTQIMDAGLYMVWGIVLAVTHRRGLARGRLLVWFVLLFGVGRFLSEFTRGDGEGVPIYGLTSVQVVLALAIPLALLVVLRPALWDRLLAWRSAATSWTDDEQTARKLRRMARVQVVVFALAFPLFPLLPLMLAVAIPLVVGAAIGLARRPGDPLWRGRLLTAFGYLAASLLFTTGFLVVHQGVTLVGSMVLLGVMAGLAGVPERKVPV